jgi:hypothetical protein
MLESKKMSIKHDAMQIWETLKHVFDSVFNGVWIGSVIGYVAGVFTSPAFLTFLTILWAIGRLYEMWLGEPFHLAIKRWFKLGR